MIRKIINSDINIINDIGLNYDKSFLQHYDLKAYLDDPVYVINIYEDNNIVKGFIIATKLYENVEILLVYVDEKYRNSGIATELINNLSTLNSENILLEVSKDNIPAISLYNKLGFSEFNIRKGYYNGVDAILMKKVIK